MDKKLKTYTVKTHMQNYTFFINEKNEMLVESNYGIKATVQKRSKYVITDAEFYTLVKNGMFGLGYEKNGGEYGVGIKR